MNEEKAAMLNTKQSIDDLLKKNNNGWIKCSDELPNKCETILLYVNDKSPFIITGWLDDYGDFTNGDECLTEYVTHWQMLPEPPTN